MRNLPFGRIDTASGSGERQWVTPFSFHFSLVVFIFNNSASSLYNENKVCEKMCTLVHWGGTKRRWKSFWNWRCSMCGKRWRNQSCIVWACPAVVLLQIDHNNKKVDKYVKALTLSSDPFFSKLKIFLFPFRLSFSPSLYTHARSI